MNPKTRSAYQRHWEMFQDWLTKTGHPLTPDSIGQYVEYLIHNGKSPRTVNAKLVAIRRFAPPDFVFPKRLKFPPTQPRILSAEDLTQFREGLNMLTADQKADVLRWMSGQETKRTYASLFRFVKKVGYLIFAREIQMGQIKGVLEDAVH